MHSLEKIYLAVRKRILKLIRGRFFVVKREEGNFLIDIYDHVSRQIEAYGLYERDQILRLFDLFEKYECERFLDVGANLGLYAIYFANRGICTTAFEPDVRIRGHLHANVFLNQLDDNIQIEPIALSDSNAIMQFERFSDQNRGRSRVSRSGNTSVTARRLDDFLGWKGEKVCIKVDIEGHELAFVRGATKFLQENVCLIQMEILEQIDRVSAELESMGYRRFDNIGHDFYFIKAN